LSYSKHSQKIKNTLHGHPFFCKIHSYINKKISHDDFSIGCAA
jgi:hypothetical protein